jgi:hypothetical protein
MLPLLTQNILVIERLQKPSTAANQRSALLMVYVLLIIHRPLPLYSFSSILVTLMVVIDLKFPIPKGTADKIITILGIVILVADNVSKLALGVGISGDAVGVGMIAKGMEEFLGGNTSAAVADVTTGAKTIAADSPAAKVEVEAIAANPLPTVEAVAPVVAAIIDEKKVA